MPEEGYSTLVWVFALLIGLFTLPVGLLIPGYFYIKKQKGEAKDQTTLEIATVLIWGVFGIIGVELGGKKGAKVIWIVFGILLLMGVVVGILEAVL